MSHGNVMSDGNASLCGNFMSPLLHRNYYFHSKLWHFTHEILHVATHVHAYK